MISKQRFATREIVIGVLIVLLVISLGVVVFKYARMERFWKKRRDIFVVFENVGSLTPDAPVRYNGLEIGRVKTLGPVHLDEKIIADHFRKLTRRDLDNLPIRSDALKRKLLEAPPDEFDKRVKSEMAGTTMVLLCLEVLAENDPIRYRIDDDTRIVTTVFGDSVVEIVSGSGPINESANARQQYVLGTAGDFFSNLAKSMTEVKDILGGVKDVIGTEERRSFSEAQARYAPANEKMNKTVKTASERMEHTLKRFEEVAQTAKAKLNQAGKTLEGLEPAAKSATESIQAALKDIQEKTQSARTEAADAMKVIKKDVEETQENLKAPWQQLRDGSAGIAADLQIARASFEKAPARLDTAQDTAGSMASQSEGDLLRFAEAGKKSVVNLKITGFVANEHKDLMLGNRDKGENLAQNVIDIQRKLAMASRRINNVGADTADALRELRSDLASGPVEERAVETVKMLQAVRAPIEEVRGMLDDALLKPWTKRKRAAWQGDGLIQW